nr:tripartite tricarboxylate transporter substrate-binding protein [Hyphomonas sp. Mor2]
MARFPEILNDGWVDQMSPARLRIAGKTLRDEIAKVFGTAFLLVCLVLALCLPAMAQTSQTDEWKPDKAVTVIVPSNPGGGFDQTARFLQRAITQNDLLATPIEVVNRGGGGGTIALAELVEQYKRRSDVLMITGFGMVGSTIMHDSDYSLNMTTPIARLTGEYQVIAVSANSPYNALSDLMSAFREDPKSISWAGGAAGGSDQIFIVQVAETMGISPSEVNYVAFTGGGETNAALMGGQVTAAITGYSEIAGIAESGRVRLLAISSPTRVLDPQLPTLQEQGIDLVFQNWRGIVAPPDITPAQRAFYVQLVEAATQTDFWQETLRRNGWEDAVLTQAAFSGFLQQSETRTRTTLESIGIEKSSNISAIGPDLFPRIALGGLILCGIIIFFPIAKNQLAGTSRLDADESDASRSGSWMNFLAACAASIAYVFGLSLFGFLIATPLFVFAILSIIQRSHWVKDFLIALALTFIIFFIFDRLLGVGIPAGRFGI